MKQSSFSVLKLDELAISGCVANVSALTSYYQDISLCKDFRVLFFALFFQLFFILLKIEIKKLLYSILRIPHSDFHLSPKLSVTEIIFFH